MSQDDQEPMLPSVSEAAQDVLAELLRQRELEPERRGEWLHLNEAKLAIRCAAECCRSFPQGWMIQLTFQIAPDGGAGPVISDTNVGIGESLEAAVLESVTSWLDGVFSVVGQAIGAMKSDSDVNVYDITTVNPERAEETAWEAHAGPFQLRGASDRQAVLVEHLAAQPPLVTVLINALTDLLSDHQESLLCVKLFLQEQSPGEPVVECKVNNVDWPQGRTALAEFAWPAGSQGMLFKQFVVIKRGESRPWQEAAESRSTQSVADEPNQKRGGCAGVIALGGALVAVVILMFAQH